MFRTFALCLLAALAVLPALGCTGGVKEREIKIEGPTDPTEQLRPILERLAAGNPLTSEASMFPHYVAEVRKTDPAKADILEKGLDELSKTKDPAARKAKAKELLDKLGPAK